MTSILYTHYIIMNPAPTELERDTMRELRKSRISRRALIAGVFFGLSYAMARSVARNDALHPGVKIVLCVLFTITFVLFFWQSERDLMAGDDELGKKIRIEAMALAFPISLGVVMLLGTLEHGGIRLLKPVNYWLPASYIYILALAWSKRRYR